MRSILFISLLFCSFLLEAQTAMRLKIIAIDQQQQSLIGNYQKVAKNEVAAKNQVQEILSDLHERSYLEASVDSIDLDTNQRSYSAYLHVGSSYQWAKLSAGNVDEEVLSKIGFRDKLYFGQAFKPKQLNRLFKSVVNYYENRGYPFVSVQLDSVRLEADGIQARLQLQKNRFYKIDSILVKGKMRISEKYLHNYIGLYPEQPYHDLHIGEISQRISEIPFLRESRPSEVRFFDDQVKLLLFLEKQKASRFDGIIGVLTDEEDGSTQLTGDVKLKLLNGFNRGETIDFNWRKLNGRSQDLRFNFIYPYLFNSPFGFDFDFKLYRQDTLFLDLYTKLGVQYLLRRNDYFKVFLQSKSSRLLSRESLISTAAGLPPLADIRVQLYGVEYRTERLDYRFNPRKGFSVLASFAVGNKRLDRIPELEEQNPGIYEGINTNNTQYNGSISARLFLPFGAKNTFLIANQSATNYSESLFQNELLRIGGLKLLRGFDEESINVSTYSITTLEYHYLLERNSYFSVFIDGGFYENNSINGYLNDTPIGIGTGISFETKAGVFALSYAVGRQFDNPISFRAAKIHFGFVNLF